MPAKPRSWAYFDTSVLVKTYVEEQASGLAIALLRNHLFLSCALAPIELMSALTRRKAGGEITATQLAMLLSRIERDRKRWTLVNLDSHILVRAESLCRDSGLSTLDALHVASALVFWESSGLRIPFATANASQRDAAEEWKLDVLWVG